jgi:hypothetical protein
MAGPGSPGNLSPRSARMLPLASKVGSNATQPVPRGYRILPLAIQCNTSRRFSAIKQAFTCECLTRNMVVTGYAASFRLVIP